MLSSAQAEPRAIEQFKREIQVIAGLKQPHIFPFLAARSDPDTFFCLTNPSRSSPAHGVGIGWLTRSFNVMLCPQ
jgi:hypothetical protein